MKHKGCMEEVDKEISEYELTRELRKKKEKLRQLKAEDSLLGKVGKKVFGGMKRIKFFLYILFVSFLFYTADSQVLPLAIALRYMGYHLLVIGGIYLYAD